MTELKVLRKESRRGFSDSLIRYTRFVSSTARTSVITALKKVKFPSREESSHIFIIFVTLTRQNLHYETILPLFKYKFLFYDYLIIYVKIFRERKDRLESLPFEKTRNMKI